MHVSMCKTRTGDTIEIKQAHTQIRELIASRIKEPNEPAKRTNENRKGAFVYFPPCRNSRVFLLLLVPVCPLGFTGACRPPLFPLVSLFFWLFLFVRVGFLLMFKRPPCARCRATRVSFLYSALLPFSSFSSCLVCPPPSPILLFRGPGWGMRERRCSFSPPHYV